MPPWPYQICTSQPLAELYAPDTASRPVVTERPSGPVPSHLSWTPAESLVLECINEVGGKGQSPEPASPLLLSWQVQSFSVPGVCLPREVGGSQVWGHAGLGLGSAVSLLLWIGCPYFSGFLSSSTSHQSQGMASAVHKGETHSKVCLPTYIETLASACVGLRAQHSSHPPSSRIAAWWVVCLSVFV